MHLADRFHPPAPYVARPYRGPVDHGAIVEVLAAHRAANGDTELPTVAQVDVTYANLHDCDPELDIALVEADGRVVAYTWASFEDLATGVRDCVVFAPMLPDHAGRELWTAIVDANEAHMASWGSDVERAQYRGDAVHPGPGLAPAREAAWFEDRGYTAASGARRSSDHTSTTFPTGRCPTGSSCATCSRSSCGRSSTRTGRPFAESGTSANRSTPTGSSSSRTRTGTRRCGRWPGRGGLHQARRVRPVA